MIHFVTFCLLFFFAATSFAQEPAVESLPVFETTVSTKPLESSFRKVITAEEIQLSGAKDLIQLLKEKAGVTTSSTAFVPDDIYIRGGDSSHVLFLVDGFAVYDAMSTNRTFNMKSVNLASIKKVEVIKGSQTAVYGGQALSAVIKIETISLSPDPKNLKVNLTGGDHKVGEAYVNWEKANSPDSIPQVGVLYQQKTRTSPVEGSGFTYPEKRITGETSWLKKSENSGTFLMRARAFDEKKNIINRTVDAQDFESNSDHQFVGLRWIGLEDKKMPAINLSYIESHRSFDHPVNVLNTSAFEQKITGSVFSARVEEPIVSEKIEALVGASYANEKGKIVSVHGQTVATDGLTGVFNQELWSIFSRGAYRVDTGWTVDAGLRWEKMPTDSDFSFQAGAAYELWRLEIAKSIKAPTLFNLYDFQYGYAGLKPEEAQILTLERRLILSDKTSLTLAGYYSKFKDLIAVINTTSGLKYQNVNESEILGIEGYFETELTSDIDWEVNAQYQDPHDESNSRRLLRRPYKTLSSKLTKSWTNKFSTSLSYFASGDRLDLPSPPTSTIVLDAYSTVGASAKYKQSENLNWKLKLQNLANKRYQESNGFNSEGLSGTLAMEYEN